MVNSCMVQGCSVRARKGQQVSFHYLPKDTERCKQWLRVINHPYYSEHTPAEYLKKLKVCSLHFKKEDFQLNVLGMKRVALLDSAIPSVFTLPEDDEQPGPSGLSSAKRIRLETETASDAALLSSSSEDDEQPITTSTPVKQPTPVQAAQFLPSTPGALDTSASSIEVGFIDESYQLESTITPTSSSSSSEDEGGKDWHEKKVIVNESSLMSLFKFCQMCGKPISSKDIFDNGAQRKVKWTCLGGHSGTWTSSPDVRGMPQVNLLSAAAVLFKGGTYTELSDWCTTMSIQMISQTTFYTIQNAYLHPAIENLYEERRNEVLARVYLEQEDGKRPHLAGDGRCDSPGFNAKYCHYTFMLDDTKKIIHTELVQCTEATSSGAMETLGFRRGLTELLDLGLEEEVMTTDRSSSIRKIMREQYPNIQHEFDIWHTAKGFRNKILTKGKKKDTAILLAWTRSIVNHMWYTCATSKGNIEALQNRWKSIIHHVCNEHEWRDDDGTLHQCDHPPLTAQDQRVRMWIGKDSVALQALSSLVLDKKLLKDLNQMALFKHTGENICTFTIAS
nr:uncharacterized protein LOC129438330 [Misgurnus anguillicaudatus]